MPAYVKEERTKAERNLIQGGFAPKPPADPFPHVSGCGQSESNFSQGWFPASFMQTDDNSPRR